jgi:large subunit ribosomal protein L24e
VLTAQAKSKDPFARPSPGLVKRLAAEARYDAKRRRFDGDDAGPSDAERQRIMEAKAKRYDRIKRGDLSGMTEREIKEAALDVGHL